MSKSSAAVNTSAETELLPQDLAAQALQACDNSVSDATGWLVRWMASHREWVAQNEHAIWTAWASATLGKATFGQRRSLTRGGGGGVSEGGRGSVSAPVASVVPFQSALTEAINANYSRMMDAPIYGGKKISEATPQEIRESAERYGTTAKTMARQARFQFNIAMKAEENGCGINEPVRTALSPKSFDEAWEASDAG